MRTTLFHKTLFALIVAGLLSTTLAVSQEAPAPKTAGLDVREHVLDNGLRLLVVNRPGVPLVSSYVWYQVGAIDETPGNTGMAHFLEHMMFKGSRNYKVGEVDGVTQRNGGSNNAFTSNDFTAYYFELPKSRYKEALKIEADRMRHLTLDEAEFDSEKKVVQSESDISADDPSSQLWERMQLALTGPTHPNSHPVLGWPQDVQDITRRDMRLFYDAHYHPNHATLVLVGDITMDEALPTVTELFGGLERGPELKRPQAPDVKFQGPVEIQVKGHSEVVEFGRQYLSVRAGHEDGPALDVLGMILGSGVTSRLYRALVEDQQIATSIAAGHQDQLLTGSFWLWAQLAEGHERAELAAAIEAEIQKLIDEGVTEDELQRTKNRFISRQVFAQESASDLASALGESQTVHGDWRVTLEYPDRIRKVTARDVRRVAAAYLYPENAVTGWLVPELTPNHQKSAGPDAAPEALPVKRHVLPNGLTVLLLERRGLPVISLSASVRTGRAGESASENGLSQFTGWLLDMGTRDYSKQQMAEAMEMIGGNLSVDSDGATARVLSEHRDIGLEMLAQCMIYPSFPQEEIELIRSDVLATLESNKNETAWFARGAASAALYGPDNPLGRPSEGNPSTVRAFTRDDVVKWHQRFFRPDNCLLAAVGDFDSAEMLKQIEAKFGAWKKPAAPLSFPKYDFKRPAKLEGEQMFSFQNFDPARVDQARKRILIDHPEKDQVVVRLQTLGISRDNPDYYALLVMDNVLGTSPGFTDRFSKKLRDEMGLAYSTYANISSGSGLYPGSFLGYIGTRPENVELALKTMYQLIDEIRDKPVSADELTAAKDYLKGSFVFDVETTGQLAGMLISMERYNLGFDYLVKYAKAVDAVTAEDVQRVARKYLVPGQMVEILAGPVTKITPAPEPPEGE
ncbi:MAG: insulinase family protein [Planctomycetes bacterium]|nr:insulinase family protein [Planctomycetota bacterium]MCB9936412.1 insulinase family protein [Planctomycetota bacterium]